MQLNFGVGTLVLKRNDVLYAKPSLLGVLQDVELDIDVTLKELMGSYAFPIDIAPAAKKITGKAKFARLQSDTLNQLMLGMTETVASGTDMQVAEPITTATSSFTVAHGATFVEDLGLYYAATGVQLQPAATATGAGVYVAGVAGVGTYTINAADENTPLLAYYDYTVTSLISTAITNPLMGSGPIFGLNLSNQYAVQGVNKKMFIKLNACRASKLTFPFKNTDYTIPDFEFQAMADASNNIGTWAMTE